MQWQRWFLCLILGLLLTSVYADVIDYIDPLIGTGGEAFGAGSVPPGPQMPWGMIRPSPDTCLDDGIVIPYHHFGGYHFQDTHIRCFSHTHMDGSGIPDLGTLGLMVTAQPVSPEMIELQSWWSTFSHDTEIARAGYYEVLLDQPQVRWQLSSHVHAAVHRLTMTDSESPLNLIIDAGHAVITSDIKNATVHVDPAMGKICGFSLIAGDFSGRIGGGGATIYYCILLNDTNFQAFGVWEGMKVFPASTSAVGKKAGAFFTYPANRAERIVEVRVGISYISVDNAWSHLQEEVGKVSLEELVTLNQNAWRQQLTRVNVTMGNPSLQTMFYTALYHAMLAPTTFSETGGEYLGFDKAVHTLDLNVHSRYLTDMSIWDTHRSVAPLYDLLYPSVQSDIVHSLQLMYEQGGDIPRWPFLSGYTACMIGTHANQVILDAVRKGIPGFNASKLYEGMRLQATDPNRPHVGRDDLTDYATKGYVCNDKSGQAVSKTLAYAFDDWAVGQLAHILGYEEDAAFFGNRSGNYRHLWDGERQLMCPRDCDGTLHCPNIVEAALPQPFLRPYDEGDAWQWTWFVPHDLAGLAELFGGKPAMLKRLSFFFEHTDDFPGTELPNPMYWAGNEPDILAPWIMSVLGDGAMTQQWTRWIALNYYSTQPDGIPGNDDYGTLSSWLWWCMLGMYPLTGTNDYALGSPLVEKATLQLGTGHLLSIETSNFANGDAWKVQTITWNGTPLAGWTISHAQISQGGILHFEFAL